MMNKNYIKRIDSMLKKLFRDKSFDIIFEFTMDMNEDGMGLRMSYDFSIDICDNLTYIMKGPKDNFLLIGFNVPDIWKLQGVHLSEGSKSEDEEICKWIRSAMVKLRVYNKSYYNELMHTYYNELLHTENCLVGSDLFHDVKERIVYKIMNECELKFRVKRVIGGLITNPDTVCPLLQLNLSSGALYIIKKGGKFELCQDLSLYTLTYTELKKRCSIRYTSFEGKFEGYTKGIIKARMTLKK